MKKRKSYRAVKPTNTSVSVPAVEFVIESETEEKNKRVITFHIDEADYEKLMKLAKADDRTMSSYLRKLIKDTYKNTEF